MSCFSSDARASDRIVIIGGGMAGIAMGVQLKRLLNHENFYIYEKSDSIGGTWAQNRYPNLSCDIASEVSDGGGVTHVPAHC
jgi:cation diffusion facilitator CzcD-associated flavoprotein CzcO